MRTERSLPRNRESRTRRDVPQRPNQTDLTKKKLARLKPWVRLAIEKATKEEKEATKQRAFCIKKGWWTEPSRQ